MFDPVTALNGRVEDGAVTVSDMGLRGMISLRADMEQAKVQSMCMSLTGLNFPGKGEAVHRDDVGLCWMSPDEMLILCDYDDVDDWLRKIDAVLSKTHHFMATNVSDARALIRVEGAFAREVIAKLSPVDLRREAFGPGQFRRSRLGQVAAAYWMREPGLIEVICFRSVAEYTFDLLATSAKAGPVGHF